MAKHITSDLGQKKLSHNAIYEQKMRDKE